MDASDLEVVNANLAFLRADPGINSHPTGSLILVIGCFQTKNRSLFYKHRSSNRGVRSEHSGMMPSCLKLIRFFHLYIIHGEMPLV